MTEFSFDRTTLDGLPGDDKALAQTAADTAELLADYYQNLAIAIVDKDRGMPPVPAFTAEQRKLARETQIIMAGAASGTFAGRMAAKILMGTQMDFYRAHPQYVAA